MSIASILRDIVSKIIPMCDHKSYSILLNDRIILKTSCYGGTQEVYECAKCHKWHVWE